MKTFASLAAVLIVTAAGAASAHDARIAWGDLDLSTSRGADAFDARVEAAARQMCRNARRPGSRLSDRAYCQAAVRGEAVRQLPGAAQAEYAVSRRSAVEA